MSETTETAVIIEAARTGLIGIADVSATYLYRGDAGQVHVLSLENQRERPDRKRESVELTRWTSFCQYVNEHAPADFATLYAADDQFRVVAVLNDSSTSAPGWLDHRAALTLRHTEPWSHWTARDGSIGSQVEFAQHIEDGLAEIVNPPAADLLELAQHFEATTRVSFTSGKRLADGSRQLTYREETDAKAGVTGTVEIPRVFELALRPFEGADVYTVEARLRFNIRDGNLSIGYVLVRPWEVLRRAFPDVVDEIEKETTLVALYGQAPEREDG